MPLKIYQSKRWANIRMEFIVPSLLFSAIHLWSHSRGNLSRDPAVEDLRVAGWFQLEFTSLPSKLYERFRFIATWQTLHTHTKLFRRHLKVRHNVYQIEIKNKKNNKRWNDIGTWKAWRFAEWGSLRRVPMRMALISGCSFNAIFNPDRTGPGTVHNSKSYLYKTNKNTIENVIKLN